MPKPLTLLSPPLWEFVGSLQPISNKSYRFYLSFEDALWALLDSRGIEGKSILYPSFFCMDVVERLEIRGAICTAYYLNRDLSISLAELKSSIQCHNPSVIFLYHPLGVKIQDDILDQIITLVPEHTLIIEDCADLLLEPDEVYPINENHFIIDSLRKVSPFQGARLFGKNLGLLPGARITHYHWITLLYYLIYRFAHLCGIVLNSNYWLNVCWRYFARHSDLIGGSHIPARGFFWDYFLSKCIEVSKIREKRALLAAHYYDKIRSNRFLAPYKIDIPLRTFSSLRFFPLVFGKGTGTSVATSLEKYSIYVDTHFDDSPQCMAADYLLLPIWQSMNLADVDRTVKALESIVSEIS